VPIAASAEKTAKIVQGAQLKVYKGGATASPRSIPTPSTRTCLPSCALERCGGTGICRSRDPLARLMTNLADCDGLLVAITHRISAFYLLRQHQRRGIGRALLTRLLAALNKRGAAEARFDVVAISNTR
jgi:GNAT superfamily N-acetyltransferase